MTKKKLTIVFGEQIITALIPAWELLVYLGTQQEPTISSPHLILNSYMMINVKVQMKCTLCLITQRAD